MISAPSREQAEETKRLAPFFAIWTGQVFSLLGISLSQFALAWWLTQSTGSATVLAFAMMMALLPQVLVSPIAGALVDRWSRRAVIVAADSSIGVATMVLAALIAAGQAQIAFVYALMFIRATATAFEWPAVQSSISLMVPQRHLSRVAGLNQTIQGLATIVAPPVGALLLEMLPIQDILGINTVMAFLAVLPLLFIRIPRPTRSETGSRQQKASILSDMGEGLRYIVKWAVVPPAIQGRVCSLVMSGSAAMSPIGLAVAGPVADLLGGAVLVRRGRGVGDRHGDRSPHDAGRRADRGESQPGKRSQGVDE